MDRPEPFTLTAQEWFNAAWERAKDHRRSFHPNTGCVYSSQGDLPGCFIGYSLPLDFARQLDDSSPLISGGPYTAANLVRANRIAVSDMPWSEGAVYLARLQRVHDSRMTDPSDWHDCLRDIASGEGLQIPD